LAVNAQVNAGNLGYNTISKYPRADFICISEKELRLEARSRSGDLRGLVEKAADHHQCGRMLITKGKEGCVCWERGRGFMEVPAFTGKVVDRVGSGDTVLTVASLCAVQNAPMEITGFLGNVAGALAVGIVCNQDSLQKIPMLKTIISMLK
jgi:sugar/nucleoside kinase (ribokinase family)